MTLFSRLFFLSLHIVSGGSSPPWGAIKRATKIKCGHPSVEQEVLAVENGYYFGTHFSLGPKVIGLRLLCFDKFVIPRNHILGDIDTKFHKADCLVVLVITDCREGVL